MPDNTTISGEDGGSADDDDLSVEEEGVTATGAGVDLLREVCNARRDACVVDWVLL